MLHTESLPDTLLLSPYNPSYSYIFSVNFFLQSCNRLYISKRMRSCHTTKALFKVKVLFALNRDTHYYQSVSRNIIYYKDLKKRNNKDALLNLKSKFVCDMTTYLK